MTTTKALNGLTPSRRYSAGANTTQTRNYRIASAAAGNIFTGDLVHVRNGVVSVIGNDSGASDHPIGVFMGCYYEEDGEPKFRKHWPTGTSASNAYAIVCDDPQATFEVSVTPVLLLATSWSTTLQLPVVRVLPLLDVQASV
jgi:hypothetical protein